MLRIYKMDALFGGRFYQSIRNLNSDTFSRFSTEFCILVHTESCQPYLILVYIHTEERLLYMKLKAVFIDFKLDYNICVM